MSKNSVNPQKPTVFISFASQDEVYKNQLQKHFSGLVGSGIIESWDGRQIDPGTDWDKEIKEKLERAEVILFLISSDFMASDYINDVEISRAIERCNKGLVKIVPVIVRPCDFKSLPIGKYQALPNGAKPISTWEHKDDAYLDVVNNIKHLLGKGDKKQNNYHQATDFVIKENPKKRRGVFVLLVMLLITVVIIGFIQNSSEGKSLIKKETQKRGPESIGKLNKDSFNYYYNLAIGLTKEGKYDESLLNLSQAESFASQEEVILIEKEKTGIHNKLADKFLKEKNYKNAIELYGDLIIQNSPNIMYRYKRALCYVKCGKIKEAVSDLKRAIESGDKASINLYNEINPIKKKLIGYITRCCDSTLSEARGRGACSHHGGVCNWNEPVYEEYREY